MAGLAALVVIGLAAAFMLGADGAGAGAGQWATMPIVRNGETAAALLVSPYGSVYTVTVQRTEQEVMAGRVRPFAEAVCDSDYVEFHRIHRLEP
jgi:hypothetical protein